MSHEKLVLAFWAGCAFEKAKAAIETYSYTTTDEKDFDLLETIMSYLNLALKQSKEAGIDNEFMDIKEINELINRYEPLYEAALFKHEEKIIPLDSDDEITNALKNIHGGN